MVVSYPTAGEGSWLSFFTMTPRVIFWYRGSIFPLIFPQIALAVCVALVAYFLANREEDPIIFVIDSSGFSVLGFLLSFLTVFKTQSSYSQFWQALTCVDGVLQVTKSLGMMTCTVVDWSKAGVQVRARRVLRLLALHYYILIEQFHRTGIWEVVTSSSIRRRSLLDQLRADIRVLAGPQEYGLLYPDEPVTTAGSDSKHLHANPALVLSWIQMILGQFLREDQALPPPVLSNMCGQIRVLMAESMNMAKIDRTQFPLPYAQIVKLLMFVFVYSLPFVIVTKTGAGTPLIAALVATGFYGLDEVAEILESPFGNNPNDIDLHDYGRSLLQDLELFYHSRDTNLDTIFTDEFDVDFDVLLGEDQRQRHQERINSLTKASQQKASQEGFSSIIVS
eukprot:TRINITY_DN28906_c0_g1_i1.p1 TRINITY_DN28906_c0_g1~~TRINITY_DN28906_c0_g1_i1.p1  ORF type:complete len:393 (+),score=37.94 TRINITY_DN28906_c0_g1_i1:103-1281(+)